MAKIDRQAMRKAMEKRMKESQSNKEQGSFDFESYYKLSKGVSQWTPKKSKTGEEHYYDTILFKVGTNHFPRVKFEGTWVQYAMGDDVYKLDCWIHKKFGPDNLTILCPRMCFGEQCPVCDHMNELLDAAADDKETRKKIYAEKAPKRRVMYNVIVRDGGDEEKKGVQIFEIAHWFMEKELQTRAEPARGRPGTINFPAPDEGKTIRFKLKDLGENKVEVTGHEFCDRNPLTDEELMGAYALDEFLNELLPYDVLYKIYWGEEVIQDDIKAEVVTDESETERVEEEPFKPDKIQSGICPYEEQGLTFGTDHMAYDVCDKCSNEAECSVEKERIKQEEMAAKEAEKEKIAKPKPRPRKLTRR